MSTHEYTRTIVSGQWELKAPDISERVKEGFPSYPFKIEMSGIAIKVIFPSNDLTQGEIDTLDQMIVDDKSAFDVLKRPKAFRIKEIDGRTVDLIDAGFEYSSKRFSLSLAAQSSWLELHQLKDDVSLNYPVVVNTIADDGTQSLADTDDMHDFFMAGFEALRAYKDAGTTLKTSIRDASTQAEIDAVVDTRTVT